MEKYLTIFRKSFFIIFGIYLFLYWVTSAVEIQGKCRKIKKDCDLKMIVSVF